MSTFRLGPLGVASRDGNGPWPLLAAMALTGVSFGALLVSMRQSATWALIDARRMPPPEVVVLVPLRAPPPAPIPARVPRTSVRTRVRSYDATRAIESQPGSIVDSSAQAVPRTAVRRASVISADQATALATMGMAMSARLTPPSAPATPWYTPPVVRNPFMPPPAPTAAEQDSIAKLMAASMEELAARRVPTVGERDAAAKEAMLKIRNSGRALMVPPDNTGGLIATRISVPVLSRGPSRAQRTRTEQAVAENRSRLERLKARADSLRRIRADSIP